MKKQSNVPAYRIIFILLFANVMTALVWAGQNQVEIDGQLKKWHRVTLTFDGPQTSETADPNPFLYYRMDVTFTHPATNTTFVVPGYYAADGNAANTSASEGSQWLVHFAPNQTGKWNYQVSFRQGDNVAVSDDRSAGQSAGLCDGQKGSFTVAASDKTGRDFRGKGMLQYVGKHHLQFADSKEFFLKAGADSPENFLAYADFDGDFKTDGQKDNLVKTWEAHIKDWKAGDPTWGDGKGKGLIGAINYLAGKGLNAVSFLTLNINGDDQNVSPYIAYDQLERMDVSRLAQWEIIFEHADKMGMYLHFKTQETENECLLDKGNVGIQRKLYYRELIARFGHHLALNWNMGEENGFWKDKKAFQSTPDRLAMAQYFYDHDPYRHLVVTHNGQLFDDLLINESKYTGLSLQFHKNVIHYVTLEWLSKSASAGKTLVVANDEQGPADDGLLTDNEDLEHYSERVNTLWGNILAGGAGCEFYFGYKHPHSDLTCQDFRSRDKFWDMCRYALEFFSKYNIPFYEMTCMDNLVSKGNWCFAKPGQIYVVCLTKGGTTQIDLEDCKKEFTVKWYNPRTGGKLLDGSVKTIHGPGKAAIGTPPTDTDKDWVVLIQSEEKSINVRGK
jgi:hypothetical protein